MAVLGRFFSRAAGNLSRASNITNGDEDAEAVAEAEAEMRSMTGNPGQDAILDEAMDLFVDWAHRALEEPGVFDEWPDVLELRDDKYNGTDDIWETGYSIIADASQYHDDEDEAGEGKGDEVS